MTTHSSIVGGSTAGRLLACKGSLQATLQLPPSTDIPSEYAEEGTAMHAVMSHLMQERQHDFDVDTKALTISCVDKFFYDRKITPAHVADMILPALHALDDLERHYGGGFEVVGIERSVKFPGIIGAYGTMDLILESATTVLHVDWKFGAGVPVRAMYTDEYGREILNAQLMFYLVASRHSLPWLYRTNKTMAIAIIQPRSDEPLTHTIVRKVDVRNYRAALMEAVDSALKPQPPRVKGEHCRFAPCKLTCPEWTGPLLDLSALNGAQLKPKPEQDGFGEYLARAKVLVDLAMIYKKEIDEQLHAHLANGGTVPGWRLKAKAKVRQWVDDAIVAKALRKLGFEQSEIWRQKLLTFEQADRIARQKGKVIPEHLRVAPATSETTIAPIDDPAPVVQPQPAIEQFRESLKLLTERAR